MYFNLQNEKKMYLIFYWFMIKIYYVVQNISYFYFIYKGIKIKNMWFK